ncbi:heterokaryon incompatibility protein-domain-containing protein [Nemania sp. FL0916]|nr:heterokaryon incompatibility protein-domain-containing protein [Nemania sp. FL0916]
MPPIMMSDKTPALQYTFLEPSRKEIRLLKLLKGQWNDSIRCELYVASLQEQPEYEALSYAWGAQTDLVDIYVNDIPVPARPNLYAALRRLREQISTSGDDIDSRTLWVDAICINQQDAEEKTEQVQLMGDIFSQTVNGLLWLGEEPNEPEPVVSNEQEDEVAQLLKSSDDFLNEISAQLPYLHIAEDLTPMPEVQFRPGAHDFKITRTRPEHWDPQFDPNALDEAGKLALEADSFYQVGCLLKMLALGSHLRWIAHLQYEADDVPATFRTNTRQALHWLGTRPWWDRIWTVQECILPKNSELLYGPIRIPWGLFLTGISNFQKHRTSCCADVPGIHDMLNNLVDRVLPCLILHRYCHDDDAQLAHLSGGLEDPSHVVSLFRPESLLWTFRHRDAKDERDKIYGLLSLLRGHFVSTGQSAKTLIVPDYNPKLSFERVFTNAVSGIIQYSASLDIICQPGFVSRAPDLRLPSWVPDFSQPVVSAGSLDRYLRQHPCYDACGGQRACISVIEENILVLEGCLVNTIADTSSTMVYVDEAPQRSVLREWYKFVKGSYDAAGNTRVDSDVAWQARFWRTLCGDTFMTRQRVLVQEDFKPTLARIPPSTPSNPSLEREESAYNLWCETQGLDELVTGQTTPATDPATGQERNTIPRHHSESATSSGSTLDRMDFLKRTVADPNDADRDDLSIGTVAYAIKTSIAGRKMFMSSNGHIGLGPPMSGLRYPQKDRIFVFPGGKAPFVLRYVGMRHLPGLGMQPCHELIGDCYLDGFMDGEGMVDFEAKKETVYLV